MEKFITLLGAFLLAILFVGTLAFLLWGSIFYMVFNFIISPSFDLKAATFVQCGTVALVIGLIKLIITGK